MIRSALKHAVSLVTSAPADVETDLIVVPVVEGEPFLQAVAGLSDATAGAIDRALASKEIQGKPYELFLTPILNGWKATRVALIGAGPAADVNLERLRRLATAAALAARQRHVVRMAFVHRLPPNVQLARPTPCRSSPKASRSPASAAIATRARIEAVPPPSRC